MSFYCTSMKYKMLYYILQGCLWSAPSVKPDLYSALPCSRCCRCAAVFNHSSSSSSFLAKGPLHVLHLLPPILSACLKHHLQRHPFSTSPAVSPLLLCSFNPGKDISSSVAALHLFVELLGYLLLSPICL